MKTRGRTDVCLILCGLLLWFLADAARVRAAAEEALALCARSVVPALFPFMAISALLVSLGFGEWVSPHLSGFMGPLFRLPGCASSALLLGLVGGYPIGAQTAARLYQEHLLTREEAERLLSFCNNANPVFLISVLGSGVFGSVRAGIWLWLIHVASALLTGLFFRGGKRGRARVGPPPAFPCRTVSLSSAFVESVGTALTGILSVCAFVVLFYVLASPLKGLGGGWGAALVGSIELFSLTPLLTPDRFGFVLAAFCSGWGGLSVLCQTAAVLDGTGLSMRSCFFGKVVQGGLSAALAVALIALF
ncbi:nucleoside recognition domain-containing protein [Oscillibacter sp.]|uniref:nucleoside recognition domain-containing protein n=1 Tax=Oscillibacter sp. TaxID=1945593 RepID=UPI002638A0C4|nr:nucleoside recognition domain-containing protein [Oscillibacter sp.]MDD3347791.1 sporulation protein [Oscillibacter sp.]